MNPTSSGTRPPSADYGPEPFIANIPQAARKNGYFRTALWTGQHLQMTLMSIPPGGDVGLEQHQVDQYIRVEAGCGAALMGPSRDRLNYQRRVGPGDGIFVPAGAWHNLRNTGNIPLKLSSVYAPPEHPHGTVHPTQAIAQAEEGSY